MASTEHITTRGISGHDEAFPWTRRTVNTDEIVMVISQSNVLNHLPEEVKVVFGKEKTIPRLAMERRRIPAKLVFLSKDKKLLKTIMPKETNISPTEIPLMIARVFFFIAFRDKAVP